MSPRPAVVEESQLEAIDHHRRALLPDMGYRYQSALETTGEMRLVRPL
jgi:hypothetical protein